MQTEPFLRSLAVFHALGPAGQQASLAHPGRLAKALRDASRTAEQGDEKRHRNLSQAEALLSRRKFDEVIRRFGRGAARHPLPLARILAQAYMAKGDAVFDRLPQRVARGHRNRLAAARRCYDSVLTLVASADDVLRNWAQTLKRLRQEPARKDRQLEWRRRVEEHVAARELRGLRAAALVKWSRVLIIDAQVAPHAAKVIASARKAGQRLKLEKGAADGGSGSLALALAEVLRGRVRLEGGDRPGLVREARNAYAQALSCPQEAPRTGALERARRQAQRLLARFDRDKNREGSIATLEALRSGVLRAMALDRRWPEPARESTDDPEWTRRNT
jgi:hypothetical protein